MARKTTADDRIAVIVAAVHQLTKGSKKNRASAAALAQVVADSLKDRHRQRLARGFDDAATRAAIQSALRITAAARTT